MSNHQDPEHRSQKNQSIPSPESGGQSLSPPPFQLRTDGDNPAQMQSFDTSDMHGAMENDYRRWTGTEGEDFDQVMPNGGEMTHGSHAPFPPLSPADMEARLIDFAIQERTTQSSLLRPEYIRTIVQNRSQHPEIEALVNEIFAAAGTDHFGVQMSALENRAFQLIDPIEIIFIQDPTTSSLDLLPPDRAQHYIDFNWDSGDYPGGPEGDHENEARRMVRELNAIRPERRANSTGNAVVTRPRFDSSSSLRTFISSELRGIPNFSGPAPGQTVAPVQPGGEELNRHAQESFIRMRNDALAHGIPLILVDSYRSAAAAAANAAASGNPSAVASFSSHSLGLAVDLQMSLGAQTYTETTTNPMDNVIDMRESPIHKWLFLRGAQYGWFPYQNEPWHWEYNPEGFREQFQAEYDASRSSGG